MKYTNISKITLVSLGAVFLLCTSLITFSTQQNINAISPASQFFNINGIPVDQQPLKTIISTEKLRFDNQDFILITYSDLSLKIVPLIEYNQHSYETEIHVNVEDNNNDHPHHKQHDNHHKWTQEDFINKYGTSLPDDGKLDDDDSKVTHHHTTTTGTVHMVNPVNDNTESTADDSDETTTSNNNDDSGAASDDNSNESSDSSGGESSGSNDSGNDSGSNDSSSDSGSSSDGGDSGDSGGSDGGDSSSE